MKCIIIANGDIRDDKFSEAVVAEGDYTICVDGGARHLERMGIVPDVVIGDLDSIGEKEKLRLEQKGVRFHRYPPRKNDTDTALAVELALAKGASDITFLGTTGSRLDHTLCATLLLKRILDTGVRGRVVNENNTVYMVKDRIELSGGPGDILSILPVSEKAVGVFLEGLEYPLANATIPFGSSIGISNRFTGKKAVIRIRDGLLLVIRSRD